MIWDNRAGLTEHIWRAGAKIGSAEKSSRSLQHRWKRGEQGRESDPSRTDDQKGKKNDLRKGMEEHKKMLAERGEDLGELTEDGQRGEGVDHEAKKVQPKRETLRRCQSR